MENSNIGIILSYLNEKGFHNSNVVSFNNSLLLSSLDPLNKASFFKIRPKSENFSLLHEASSLLSLSHKNIVSFKGFFENESFSFLELERAPGQCLIDLLIEEQKLTENESRIIFKQLVSVLKFMIETENMVHLDLKPDNLMWDRETQLLTLIDFEVSKKLTLIKKRKYFKLKKTENRNNTNKIEFKKLKTQRGTVQFMSPEVVQKRKYDGPSADVWSLGVTLFTLVCGFFPNWERGEQQIFGLECCNVSKEVKDLIFKMMKRESKERINLEEIEKHCWFQNL